MAVSARRFLACCYCTGYTHMIYVVGLLPVTGFLSGPLAARASRRSPSCVAVPAAPAHAAVRVENRESKVEGASSWWPSARRKSGPPGHDDVDARCSAVEHMTACNTRSCSSSLPAPPACPWWLFATSSVPAASLPSQRAQVAPASSSYDAHRQRSCGIAGRTCDTCGRYRFQWPGGRPCIGYSRLTTGEGMDRSTTATLQAASGATPQSKGPNPVGPCSGPRFKR